MTERFPRISRAALVACIALGTGVAAERGVKTTTDLRKKSNLVGIVSDLGDVNRELSPVTSDSLNVGSSTRSFLIPAERDLVAAKRKLAKGVGEMKKEHFDTTSLDGKNGVLNDLILPSDTDDTTTAAQKTIFEAAKPVAAKAASLDNKALQEAAEAAGVGVLGLAIAAIHEQRKRKIRNRSNFK